MSDTRDGDLKSLTESIEKLPSEMEASHDLWPKVESRINAENPIKASAFWRESVAAASVLLSIALFSYSAFNLNKAERLYATVQKQQDSRTGQEPLANQNFRVAQVFEQVQQMEHEYRLARLTVLAQIRYSAGGSAPEILSQIDQSLAQIQHAAATLKDAIAKSPNNPELPKMLKATYQQELVALTQLVRLNQRVFKEEII